MRSSRKAYRLTGRSSSHRSDPARRKPATKMTGDARMTAIKLNARTAIAAAAVAAAVSSFAATNAQAGTMTMNIAFKGASQRAVWQSVLDDFKKAHPEIDVKASFVDEE